MTPTDAYISNRDDDGRLELSFGKPEQWEYIKVELTYEERQLIIECATEDVQRTIQFILDTNLFIKHNGKDE